MRSSPMSIGYDAVVSETVMLRGYQDDYVEAYVSRPLGKGPFPGVVIMHHMPGGYDDESKDVCRRLGVMGYSAIMPNLHYRAAPGADHDAAVAAVRALGGRKLEETLGDAEAAISLSRSQVNANGSVGVIGFCLGGKEAFLAACRYDVDALVLAWPTMLVPNGAPGAPTDRDLAYEETGRPWPIEEATALTAPVLGLFGARDHNPSVHAIDRIGQRLDLLGKVHSFFTYPDAGHAFMAPERDTYAREASVDAWLQISKFFGDELLPPPAVTAAGLP